MNGLHNKTKEYTKNRIFDVKKVLERGGSLCIETADAIYYVGCGSADYSCEVIPEECREDTPTISTMKDGKRLVMYGIIMSVSINNQNQVMPPNLCWIDRLLKEGEKFYYYLGNEVYISSDINKVLCFA